MAGSPLRVISWNVNGIRACVRNGFVDWLRRSRAAIVGLQEVRALEAEIPATLCGLRGWHLHLSPAARRGYSGVGLLSRRPFDALSTALHEPRFDTEARIQLARRGRLQYAGLSFRRA